MPDADKILKLLIDMGVTGKEDVQAANAELAQTGHTTTEAAKATEGLGKESEHAAEKIQLFHGQGREMHRVIHEVTRISPLLGEALRVAMHPVAGTVAAAIGLFVLMKEHIKEVNKELDDMAEKAAEPAFLEGIHAKQEILREAAAAAQEYAAHLDDIAGGEHNVTAELTAQLALQKSINEARTAQATAEEALAQARIRAQVARGKITPEAGEVAIADAKRKSIADGTKAKQNAEDQEVVTKTRSLEKLDVPGDQANAKALTDTYTAEKGQREKTAKDFGDADKIAAAQKAAQKIIDDANATAEKDANYRNAQALQRDYIDKGRAPSIFGGGALTPEIKVTLEGEIKNLMATLPDKVKFALDHAQQATVELNNLRAGRAQYEADVKSDPDFNALKIAMEAAVKKADETTGAQAKLSGEITALTSALKVNRPTENATVKTKQDEVFFDLAATLEKGLGKTKTVEQKIIDGHATPEETKTGLAESQSTTRALIAAVKEAKAADSSALPELVAGLKAQWEATIQLATKINKPDAPALPEPQLAAAANFFISSLLASIKTVPAPAAPVSPATPKAEVAAPEKIAVEKPAAAKVETPGEIPVTPPPAAKVAKTGEIPVEPVPAVKVATPKVEIEAPQKIAVEKPAAVKVETPGEIPVTPPPAAKVAKTGEIPVVAPKQVKVAKPFLPEQPFNLEEWRKNHPATKPFDEADWRKNHPATPPAAAPTAASLNLAPLQASSGEYHAANLALHQKNQQGLDAVAAEQKRMAAELKQLAQQGANGRNRTSG
jgi:hypothetical protein